MKLRIFLRIGGEDCDGRFTGYRYITEVVDIPYRKDLDNRPEVIGGEWVEQG